MVVLLGVVSGGASALFGDRRQLLQAGSELSEPAAQGLSATKK
jgi:hypothetical protein